jgi:amidohydrolase
MSLRIADEILNMKAEMVALRRHFHAYPELGMEETRTSETIANRLNDLGLKVDRRIGKTGVVGLLEGKGPGKTVMLRADMDALPIQEENDVIYRSQNEGVMHACGHDGHMAVLLTVAKILSAHRQDFRGNVKFVFSPGEEGFAGARLMIEDGVLEGPQVDAAFALHLMTSIPIGFVGVCAGPMMACMDAFTIEIKGKGAHAAMPEEGADAILMSAHVVSALQSLITREVSPLIPFVVHVGTICGGNAFNIVAEHVELKGTVRTHDEVLREFMPERIGRIVKGITEALKGTYRLDYQFGYPPVVNDAAMTDLVRRIGIGIVGKEGMIDVAPTMTSDDMGFFLEQVPGCYFFVGAGNSEKGLEQPHHNARFDFDEEAMPVGVEVLARVALTYLGID